MSLRVGFVSALCLLAGTAASCLGDIKDDVREIRILLEDDNGEEEEASEADR